MSLYGSDKRYTVGAIRNAQLLPVIFPGWHLWIHYELPHADTPTRYSVRRMGMSFSCQQSVCNRQFRWLGLALYVPSDL